MRRSYSYTKRFCRNGKRGSPSRLRKDTQVEECRRNRPRRHRESGVRERWWGLPRLIPHPPSVLSDRLVDQVRMVGRFGADEGAAPTKTYMATL
jgi:hypothetical protein